MSLFERWRNTLDRLRALGQYRHLAVPQGVDFSSNDYLGYGKIKHPPLASEWARSGAASRLLRGQQQIWHNVELALAAWHRAETALIMTSGYIANEGLLSTILEPTDWIASDALNHASIIDGLRLTKAQRFIYHHADLNHLEHGLREARQTKTLERQLFIVTEALFSMDGDLAPLLELATLARRFGAHLIVDEAHATGCFGDTGSGLVDAAGLRDGVLATVHTGGKALGVAGAYICGPAALRDLLINRCRHLIFTTALPPVMGAWWLESVERVRGDAAGRRRLHDNAALFRRDLAQCGVVASGDYYIVPVLVGNDAQAVEAARGLQQAGFDIRAIRPPTVPPGTARLRIVIHADHTPEQLSACAAAVAEVLK